MKRFKSPRQLQRFVSIHDPIANLFHIQRHDIASAHHRELRDIAIFILGARATTLPKMMWDGVTNEVNPTISAVSLALVAISAIVGRR
jgi:hypothetical protein